MKGIVQHICVVIIILCISNILKAQDGFRVHPYLQHPTSDAMTILWFSEEQLPGQLSWWKQGTSKIVNVESGPVPADELSYSIWEETTFFGGAAPAYPYRHRIRMEGLESGTTYEYSVWQGTDSFTSTFRTAPSGNDSIRIIVYADSETEPESTGNYTTWIDPVSEISRSYLVDQTTGYGNNLDVIRSRQPDLVLIAGDLTQHGGEQRDWDEFWRHNTNTDRKLSLAGQVPLLAAPGNHDYYEGTYLDQYNQPGSERAIHRFLTYFESPANHSPNGEQEGRYYSLKYGPATLIILDVCNNSTNGSLEDTNFYLLGETDPEGGNAPDFGVGSRQYSWLESQLEIARDSSLFIFVVFHHAPYSSGPHGFPPGVGTFLDNQSGVPVQVLTPLLMKYGVDAVFSGHDEMWERAEVSGAETLPDGNELNHTIHFYDVGTGGDGLRGPETGANNPYQHFFAHRDAPEVWEEGILVEGGKHYGHLEIDIEPLNDSAWQAILSPVYIFPLYNSADSSYSGYERRVYDDLILINQIETDQTVSTGDRVGLNFHARSYPNPFYSQSTIEYCLPESCEVTISIFDALGRPVRILPGGFRTSGSQKTMWDGTDSHGNRISPGLYYYLVETSSGNQFSGSMVHMISSSGSF